MDRKRIWFYVALFVCCVSTGLPAEQIIAQNAGKVQRLRQLKGHTGPVFSLAFSPDVKRLISGGSADDHSVRIWDVSSGTQQVLCQGNTRQVAAVGFSADGTKALSAGYDASIRIWDATQGKQVGVISKTAEGSNLSVDNLFTAFSANGSKLAYSPDSGEGPFLVDVATRKQANLGSVLQPSGGVPGAIALDSSGSLLAVIGKEGKIYLVDAKTGKETGMLTPAEKSEYSGILAFSGNGAMLAVSNYDTSNIQILHVQTKEAGPLLVGHKNNADGTMMINGLAFSPDGKLLVSTSYDKTIRLWDVGTGKCVATLNASAGKGPTAVVWSPDGSIIASADLDGTITLWGVH